MFFPRLKELFLILKEKIKASVICLTNLPKLLSDSSSALDSFFKKLSYTLSNLARVNLDLGIYHLRRGNFSDALIRFKLVDKFFDPGNKEAAYRASWIYFLKGDIEKCRAGLSKAGDFDPAGFKTFLDNYTNLKEVPEKIWTELRNMDEPQILGALIGEGKDLFNYLAKKTLSAVGNLPEKYSLLEISPSPDRLSSEIKKYFPDEFTLTRLEAAAESREAGRRTAYDKLIEKYPPSFFKGGKEKYDIIISLCGLSFSKDVKNTLESALEKLKNGGALSFVARTGLYTEFSKEFREIIFNYGEIKKAISDLKLNLLTEENFLLGNKNKYSIFVVRK